MVTVTAGAGFGKSTLLSQELARSRGGPQGDDCWLGCERADGDAAHLADGLLRALRAAEPASTSGGRLGGDLDDERDHVEEITRIIWSRAPRQIAIILDDVHEIDPASDGAAMLDDLIRSVPGNGHVVLVARTTPPVALAKLRASGHLVEIEESDLAFTDVELAAFADLRRCDPSQLAGLGGWPALVEITAGTRHADVEGFIVEEVLAARTSDEVELIEALALIGGGDNELLGIAVERTIDRRELNELMADVPLAVRDESGWWRLHPLWTTAVEQRVGSRRRADLLGTTGRGLTARDPVAALDFLLEAGNDDDTITCLRALVRTPWSSPGPGSARRLHARLPAHLLDRPEAQMLFATAVASSAPGDAVRVLHDVADDAEQRGDDVMANAATERLVVIANRRQDVAELVDAFARIHRIAQPTERIVELVTLSEALVANTQGDAAAVLDALDRLHPARLDPTWRSPVLWMRAQATFALGYPDAALEDSVTALEFAPESLRGELAMLHANLLAFTGQVEATAVMLEDTSKLLHDHGTVETRAMAHGQAAQFLALRGDLSEARRRLAQAVELAGPDVAAPLRATLSAADVLVGIAALDEEHAAEAMAAALRDQPLGSGRALYAYRRKLPMIYVLAPDTRDYWDATELGPVFRLTLDVARALVALRESLDTRPARRLTEAHWSVAPACVPLPWICELALAGSIDGSPEAGLVLKSLDNAAAHTAIRSIAARSQSRPLAKRARERLAEMPLIPPRRLRIDALGPLTVHHDDEPLDHAAWRRERVRMLLAFLVVHRRTTREQAGVALWPDLDDAAASRNLRVTLSYLLSAIEPGRASGSPSYFVRTDGGRLELVGGDLLHVDLDSFVAAVEDAAEMARRGSPADELASLLDAVALYRDMPFADLGPVDWIIEIRDRITARFVQAAIRAGELSAAIGDHDRARALAERAVGAEPWSEAARRLLVLANLELGDRAAARRCLDACFAMLDDLGVSAEPETLVVARRLA